MSNHYSTCDRLSLIQVYAEIVREVPVERVVMQDLYLMLRDVGNQVREEVANAHSRPDP